MRYGEMTEGIFRNRRNRFIAEIEIRGRVEACHVKNTGRCRELLIPGARVWVEHSDNPARKTAWSLITVEKSTGDGPVLVNLDSQAPNQVAKEWLTANAEKFGLTRIRPECTCGDSRFDFYLEWADGRSGFLEVKGVTLECGGTALFPDAPTERGVKHLRHLTAGMTEGRKNGILFVIAMKGVRALAPNDRTHPAFGEALRDAAAGGVRVMAVDCTVGIDSLVIDSPVEVDLTDSSLS